MALMKRPFQKLYEILLFFISLFPQPDNLGDTSITDVVIKSNWVVVIAASVIHILYILCQFWTTNRDVIDHFMYKRAIDINDIPAGSYRYLITVYTNWRVGAGTDAKVFIQMNGVLGQNTICYYLHNPYLHYRKLFGWSDVSWFSLNTSIPIGEIKSLIVAHDNTGDYAAWYLTKIIVRDMQMNKSWRFFASCWLTEDIENPQAKAKLILKPVDPDYIEPFLERMFEWARRIYRERPLTSWYNLNYITPLSRSQRLTITYVYLLTLMLLSIAYFASENKKDDIYLILTGMMFRTVVSYLVLLTLNLIYSIDVFTTRHPTKTKHYIRITFSILVHIWCVVMTIFIIIYSTNKTFTGYASVRWLFQFVLGILQSELMIAVFVTFSKAFLFTLFARDPFEEEAARIQLSRRISTAKTFSYKKSQ